MKSSTDWLITGILVLLSLTSLVVLFSISPERLPRQATYLFVGFLIFLYLSRLDSAIFINLSPWAYAISITLLFLTLVLGDPVRGTSRWFEIFGFRLQASELVKPLLILSFSGFIAKWKPTNLKNAGKNILFIAIPAMLIFLQPDLGTTMVYLVIWGIMMFVGGLSSIALLLTTLLASLLVYAVPFILKDYQLARLHTFIDPYSDPLGSGYNVIQSMIAIGSGKIFGKGLGRGTQSHLKFLPEKHTDFIFASLAEEFGLIGAASVIFLFIILLARLFHQTLRIQDDRKRLIITGVFSYLFFQSFLNLGMNLGIAPVTGVTLPLISFGGSSVIATFTALGIAASVTKDLPARPSIEIR